MRSRDPCAALLRALIADAPPIATCGAVSRDWASATFTGATHRLTLEMDDGAAARGWLEALPEAELNLAGHILADIAVEKMSGSGGRLIVELRALTLARG